MFSLKNTYNRVLKNCCHCYHPPPQNHHEQGVTRGGGSIFFNVPKTPAATTILTLFFHNKIQHTTFGVIHQLHCLLQESSKIRNPSLGKLHPTFLLQRQIQFAGRLLFPLVRMSGGTIITIEQILVQRTLLKLLIHSHLYQLFLVGHPVTFVPVQCGNGLGIQLHNQWAAHCLSSPALRYR